MPMIIWQQNCDELLSRSYVSNKHPSSRPSPSTLSNIQVIAANWIVTNMWFLSINSIGYEDVYFLASSLWNGFWGSRLPSYITNWSRPIILTVRLLICSAYRERSVHAGCASLFLILLHLTLMHSKRLQSTSVMTPSGVNFCEWIFVATGRRRDLGTSAGCPGDFN